jgi:hypothetical protein
VIHFCKDVKFNLGGPRILRPFFATIVPAQKAVY